MMMMMMMMMMKGCVNHCRFEAANSIEQRETGYTRHKNGKDILVKKGYYRFVSPEGLPFRVDYQADENGFRAIGKHLPK
jgi:hypothetical protein